MQSSHVISVGYLRYCPQLPDPRGKGVGGSYTKTCIITCGQKVTVVEKGRASATFVTLAVMKVTDPMMMQWPKKEGTMSRNNDPPKAWHKNCAGPRDDVLLATLSCMGKPLS